MSDLTRLLDEFFAFWWAAHPVDATAMGIHTHDGELASTDEVARAEHARHCREYLDAIERLSPRDVGEQIDRTVVRAQLRWELHELEQVRRYARDPGPYVDAPLHALYLMAVRDYAPAVERARRATERLIALPRLLDEARANLTRSAVDPAESGPMAASAVDTSPVQRAQVQREAGRDGHLAAVPVLVQTAAEVARAGLDLIEGMLPLSLGPALEGNAHEFARWENARRGAASALVAYAEWLEQELAPRAAGDFALGRALFEAKVREVHGLGYTVDELRAYGLALKAQVEDALANLAAELMPGKSWRDVAEQLKGDHPSADRLIQVYAEEMARARDFVEERGLATIPAGEALEVIPTPEYLRPLIPYAAYQSPAAHETDQTGLFFVTPPPAEALESALRDHCVYGIPVTALHEGYPGHHLQLTHANRADSEPRRVFWTPVFAEGWALYCEEMMWEQGFYADRRQRLLQLKDLLWRACRVVIDVGLHVDGWSFERAVEYLAREAGLERPNAEVEVRRYCAEPTYPMSYAVGKREVLRLRQSYRGQRGDAFELRDFHDRVLSWGTLPPPLIAQGLGLEVSWEADAQGGLR